MLEGERVFFCAAKVSALEIAVCVAQTSVGKNCFGANFKIFGMSLRYNLRSKLGLRFDPNFVITI